MPCHFVHNMLRPSRHKGPNRTPLNGAGRAAITRNGNFPGTLVDGPFFKENKFPEAAVSGALGKAKTRDKKKYNKTSKDYRGMLGTFKKTDPNNHHKAGINPFQFCPQYYLYTDVSQSYPSVHTLTLQL